MCFLILHTYHINSYHLCYERIYTMGCNCSLINSRLVVVSTTKELELEIDIR